MRFFDPANGADTVVLQSAYMAGKLWQDEAFKAAFPEADWDGAREFKVSEGYEPLIFDLDATDEAGNSLLGEPCWAMATPCLHISKDLKASEARGQAQINASVRRRCSSRLAHRGIDAVNG